MAVTKSIQPSRRIPSLAGKRAVITTHRVEIVAPIESGGAGVDAVYAMLRLAHPGSPCAIVFDGEVRAEYGRPLDDREIDEALFASGMI